MRLETCLGIAFAPRLAMDPVMVLAPRDGYTGQIDRSRTHYRHIIRVLRWTFRREHEAVVCEMGLTGEDREYEIRIPAEWNPTHRAIECFDDALTAFQRHAMIERTLLNAGWVLGTFESEQVTLH